jgi:hypothetical protein
MNELLKELEIAEKRAQEARDAYHAACRDMRGVEFELVRQLSYKEAYDFLSINRARLRDAIKRGIKI